MKHRAAPLFWRHYNKLPPDIQKTADRCFVLLTTNPRHPSLHLKRTGDYWSVRAGLRHRALAKAMPDGGMLWFWIGAHDEYENILRG